jgi:hypothetical protein
MLKKNQKMTRPAKMRQADGGVPTQTVKEQGQRPKLVRGSTQTDQIEHDLKPKDVGPLEMPFTAFE